MKKYTSLYDFVIERDWKHYIWPGPKTDEYIIEEERLKDDPDFRMEEFGEEFDKIGCSKGMFRLRHGAFEDTFFVLFRWNPETKEYNGINWGVKYPDLEKIKRDLEERGVC